jgi:hypothetical protein
MGEALAILMVANLAATVGGFLWLGRRLRRRGHGGEIMAPFDDIFHPAAHLARFEIHAHAQRKVPTPAPGDPWRDAGA